jgi:ribonuclease-3
VERSALLELESRLGHGFSDARLLQQALTHASYANEHPPCSHHENLALLGDAALALAVAEHLLRRDFQASVGVLSRERATVVSGPNLAAWAREIGVGPLLLLGRGEDQRGGRDRESILATALEALLAVVYLEGGVPAVSGVVGRLARW